MSRGERGFTLIEVVIALTLATVVTVLLFGGLRLGTRAWERIESANERLAALRTARQFIERTLRQTRDLSAPWGGRSVAVFAGDSERLELVAPLAAQVGAPGLYVLRFAREPTATGAQLVLTRWLLHPEVLAGTAVSPAWMPLAESGTSDTDWGAVERDLAGGAYGRTVLLAEVEQFALAYFGIPPGETEPRWSDAWLGYTQLPRHILLRLTAPGQNWPDAILTLPGPGEAVSW